MLNIGRIRVRSDFLAAASSGRKGATSSVVVQIRQRADDGGLRCGFTATKKIGNAVARNLAKRRLREASRIALCGKSMEAKDIVFIGRSETLTRNFRDLVLDIGKAMRKANG